MKKDKSFTKSYAIIFTAGEHNDQKRWQRSGLAKKADEQIKKELLRIFKNNNNSFDGISDKELCNDVAEHIINMIMEDTFVDDDIKETVKHSVTAPKILFHKKSILARAEKSAHEDR